MNRKTQQRLVSLLRIIILALYLIVVLAPLYWLFITSVKTKSDIYTMNIQYWPKHFTLQNYVDLWNATAFPEYFKNSIVISIISAVFVLILCILGGYALARYDFKWKKATLFGFLITQMVPVTLLLIPLYILFAKLGLVNTSASLLVFYIVINVPFCLITMRSFFERIPKSLEEAAMVDGCTKFQTLVRIVLPVMLPGIVATFVFAFTGAWNELLGGVMFINTESLKTIPVGLNGFVGKFDVNWGQMTAGGILALIPTVILFAIVQKYIVEGLTQGSVKE